MKNTRYQDARSFYAIKHDVPPMFYPAQARPDMIAGAAQFRIMCQLAAARFKFVEISKCLIFPPRTDGVGADVPEVGLSQARQTDSRHLPSAVSWNA